MLKGYRYVVLLAMIILFIAGCAKEDKDEVQSLLSDKQSQTEEVSQNTATEAVQQNAKDGVEVESQLSSEKASELTSQQTVQSAEDRVQQSSHKPTSQQKIVYTKLNSWSDTEDYYEIAFNTPIKEEIKPKDLKEYIEFSPRTKGRYEKLEDKVIRFYPEDRFKGDTDYKVKIDQATLLAGEYAKVELSFYNASPILTLGQVALYPSSKSNEYYLEFVINHYRGRYPDKDYRKGMNIYVGSNLVQVDKINYDNSGKMVLTTNTFTATENDKFRIQPNSSIFKNESKKKALLCQFH